MSLRHLTGLCPKVLKVHGRLLCHNCTNQTKISTLAAPNTTHGENSSGENHSLSLGHTFIPSHTYKLCQASTQSTQEQYPSWDYFQKEQMQYQNYQQPCTVYSSFGSQYLPQHSCQCYSPLCASCQNYICQWHDMTPMTGVFYSEPNNQYPIDVQFLPNDIRALRKRHVDKQVEERQFDCDQKCCSYFDNKNSWVVDAPPSSSFKNTRDFFTTSVSLPSRESQAYQKGIWQSDYEGKQLSNLKYSCYKSGRNDRSVHQDNEPCFDTQNESPSKRGDEQHGFSSPSPVSVHSYEPEKDTEFDRNYYNMNCINFNQSNSHKHKGHGYKRRYNIKPTYNEPHYTDLRYIYPKFINSRFTYPKYNQCTNYYVPFQNSNQSLELTTDPQQFLPLKSLIPSANVNSTSPEVCESNKMEPIYSYPEKYDTSEYYHATTPYVNIGKHSSYASNILAPSKTLCRSIYIAPCTNFDFTNYLRHSTMIPYARSNVCSLSPTPRLQSQNCLNAVTENIVATSTFNKSPTVLKQYTFCTPIERIFVTNSINQQGELYLPACPPTTNDCMSYLPSCPPIIMVKETVPLSGTQKTPVLNRHALESYIAPNKKIGLDDKQDFLSHDYTSVMATAVASPNFNKQRSAKKIQGTSVISSLERRKLAYKCRKVTSKIHCLLISNNACPPSSGDVKPCACKLPYPGACLDQKMPCLKKHEEKPKESIIKIEEEKCEAKNIEPTCVEPPCMHREIKLACPEQCPSTCEVECRVEPPCNMPWETCLKSSVAEEKSRQTKKSQCAEQNPNTLASTEQKCQASGPPPCCHGIPAIKGKEPPCQQVSVPPCQQVSVPKCQQVSAPEYQKASALQCQQPCEPQQVCVPPPKKCVCSCEPKCQVPKIPKYNPEPPCHIQDSSGKKSIGQNVIDFLKTKIGRAKSSDEPCPTIPPNPCCHRLQEKRSEVYRFFVICIFPIVILFSFFTLSSGTPVEKPPCKDYEYMRRRTKRFPWGEGDKSLFHNDETNNLPGECDQTICKKKKK